MDVALVEDAEDDVDGDQRSEDEQRLVGERGLEGLGRSLERGAEARRETETTGGGLDGGDGVAEGDPGGEVEGEGDGGKLPLVVDREWRRTRRESRDRGERHLRTVRRADVQILQRR